jgi:hypothetical protein
MSNTDILALHRHPGWTKGEEGARKRHVWPYVSEVGYAAGGKSAIKLGKDKRYARVMVGLVVLRR